ncbi:ABC transporter ATP-binding protein [Hymenobacter siberiensis]|jgi:putative ABC transport system ATP-binding protein|uniref:ABC transporter ATP-binding protein n=1 Tax=Hymenobacter siberiensis TaxID=2848396 RepID=UPI001C1E6A20|nr:ABC transporter ATP-binding protein [Hymenobacter siberiensis]MBU6120632.1 ABC transporter ATP-binding protein [Hymenobacter siberiensis]
MATSEYVAQLRQASKVYQTGDTTITALAPSDLDLRAGEMLLIVGPSGSGKTTLLSLLGCVMYPTKGQVLVNGHDISQLTESELAELRLHTIGFVFQSFNLIQPLTAEENVLLPLRLQQVPLPAARARAAAALALVAMTDRARQLPKELSGGQQQRVAIARALVTEPTLILCDEPTASLDARSVEVVMRELKTLVQQGKALAVVTHDLRLRSFADRIVYMDEGRVTDVPQPDALV